MFTEDNIMTAQDFNEIEQRILTLRGRIINLGYSVDSYTAKTWLTNDFLLYTYLNNIEEGIKALGKGYFRPYGWKKTKTWAGGMSFSYRDVNRWITDLDLIEERLDNESSTLFPSDTLYPSETLFPH